MVCKLTRRYIHMLFGTFAFAETAFAADRLIIGTFPIFPFNQHTLTFVMSLNFESGFSLSTNTLTDFDGLINTGFDIEGQINTQQDHNGKINRQFDYNFVR